MSRYNFCIFEYEIFKNEPLLEHDPGGAVLAEEEPGTGLSRGQAYQQQDQHT